ncbi:hypothetical protein GOP47_0004058 [Adiantum capillus-veneris]|uniref:non-specific serine/threonine protein kinase n=1 Tax=Adiantum capillus-veneris TaxID=13818 RepID=A0A9D4ZQ08_ADICA|nr:hypothetical protein GOP47_0004058 [Adiantum capillus-veneris]
MANHNNKGFHIMTEHDYCRISELSDMSVDSQRTGIEGSLCNGNSSFVGGSCYGDTSMQNGSSMHSSMGSTDSRMMLMPHDQRTKTRTFPGHSVVRRSRVTQSASDDALVNALLDEQYPTGGLEGYNEWTIDLSKLTMGPAFAQGAFGRIYKACYKGEDVAVKILERPLNDLDRAQSLEQQFVQEVVMLANLRHENVVRFVGACQKPRVWCIVTEYVKGGSLRLSLAKRRAPPLRLALRHALDIAKGMEHLHDYEVIHRDLKSDNLLMADRCIKIADFGVARIEVQSEDMTPETGTYRWMAPEMMQNRSYTHKVDVYSFGIVLWELVTGNIPFQKMTAVQAASAVVRGARPIIPTNCPDSLTKIMTCCWDANPDVRPSFSDVVRLLEDAQMAITKSVGTPRFRGCGCLRGSPTLD